jgi:ATP-binding cassette subfamily F protein uup
MFARPTNILVLDEPTNDLDIETLELLEDLLQDYPGTVLLVSHDRAFLDNVVTQTYAAEDNGHWQEYVGGYDEWLEQRPQQSDPAIEKARKKEAAAAERAKPVKAARVTSWEARELEEIPDTIAQLEAKQSELTSRLADGSLYRESPEEVDVINQQLQGIEQQLHSLFARWEALEEKKNGGT